MRWRRESRLALGLGLVAALLLGAALSGAAGAGPRHSSAGSLRRHQAGLAAKARTALLQLYALDSRLTRTRVELGRLQDRAAALRVEEARVRREMAVVTENLRASQHLLGNRLRTLYEQGEPNALAVLLGANSLQDAATRLEELDRSARQGQLAATDAKDGRTELNRLAAALAARVREVQGLEALTRQTANSLARARAEHLAYIASLARQRHATARQIATLDSRARQVVQRAQTVATQRTSSTTAPAGPPVFVSAQTLAVTATGYSLPGHTATGLPVGFGVVAVDPSVIPLGTRMTIPGYGEGVAADTGSAVLGNTIDLWFPTPADALAWGRRTVTITLH